MVSLLRLTAIAIVLAGDDAGAADVAANAVFATDNYQAGILIGRYAQAAPGSEQSARIDMLDLFPGHPVGAQRHNGFLAGFVLPAPDAASHALGKAAAIRCAADTHGDQAKG